MVDVTSSQHTELRVDVVVVGLHSVTKPGSNTLQEGIELSVLRDTETKRGLYARLARSQHLEPEPA